MEHQRTPYSDTGKTTANIRRRRHMFPCPIDDVELQENLRKVLARLSAEPLTEKVRKCRECKRSERQDSGIALQCKLEAICNSIRNTLEDIEELKKCVAKTHNTSDNQNA
jgi:hypothetical protein